MLRSLILLFLAVPLHADDGVLPTGADGKPLNLDFETGTLKDWTLEGEAFKGQPIEGDVVHPRRNDMKSEHQGKFWIGGYEKLGDKPLGTLTSVPFKVTHPWASFLVAGGTTKDTCVELVRKDSGKVFFWAAGTEEENLRRMAVNLKEHQGQEIFIRVVDRHAGHWGHVNFDDFRFHTDEPKVPKRAQPATADDYKFAGLQPEQAAKEMTVPAGFEVKLFAGEPDVHQPIAMCTDDRGRVWVVEAYVYPRRAPEPGVFLKERGKGDRIVIFEDSNNDGKFDKRTVFLEGLNLVSGIELGYGGVWIGAAPYLLFIPYNEGEDKPSGEPKILLDGWGYQDTHETLNSFTWGPDGWLYGCHGVFTHSRVGKPNTPNAERIPINAGVWRYHPVKHHFEVFAHGTSNPWGLDYNEKGDWFVEACVIPHNWHIIPGGRYQRQAGTHFNPYTFDDIKTIAEHRHYVGATPHSGNNRSDSVGGGHAHSGTLIYQGGLWPEEYRGKMFMGNIHGHRLNVDTLTAKGSGYVASRHPDFLLTNDRAALLVAIHAAPDGNVYVLDWYDKQSCHRNEPEIWDRSNGRIYKIVMQSKEPPRPVEDLKKLKTPQLLQIATHPQSNEWRVRHARRILNERKWIANDPEVTSESAHRSLHSIMCDCPSDRLRLRSLWVAHATGQLEEKEYEKLLQDKSPHVRAWAIRTRVDFAGLEKDGFKTLSPAELGGFFEHAEKDDSPMVRLALASALQRIPLEQRWPIAEKLLAHSEDLSDHNLPLMYWYAVEPLATLDPAKALTLVSHGKFPMLVQFMARRIAMVAREPEHEALVVAMLLAQKEKNREAILPILRGMSEGFRGRRDLKPHDLWTAFYPSVPTALNSPEAMLLAENLAIQYGDSRAINRYLEKVVEPLATVESRLKAIDLLLEVNHPDLAPSLQTVLKEPALRSAALRGLARYGDPKTPEAIFAIWKELTPTEKREAVTTLASRAPYAKNLLDAIADGKVKSTEVPSDVVRVIRNLPDAGVAERIAKVWGVVRDTPADRAAAISDWRKKLTAKGTPDLSLGRAAFQKTCAQCHTLYGVGGKVGPDITGSNRGNIEYLLENIFDPSAVIPNDYKMSTLVLASGQTLQGIIQGEANQILTVQTATEKKLIPRADIESIKPSNVSMMPEDVLKPLSEIEIRSLFAYLQASTQVPIMLNADNAKEFFNGQDLTNWVGDPKLWRVENGEIIGKTDGLKKNNFLYSQFTAENFKLALKVKLTPNKENSGIQFRSLPLSDGEMKGYQADIGAGWWGKLYEESGRGLLFKESGEKHVKVDDWNEYVIIANGSKIQTFINGQLCTDLDDPAGDKRGVFAVQLHSGGAMEVRFKDLKLEPIGK